MKQKSEEFQKGDSFGTYTIIRTLGSGGFGTVYLALHRYLGVEIALKVFPRCDDVSALKDIQQEAMVTARLRHSSIITILDFGIEDSDRPYIVMEYATGGTLRSLHPRGTVLSASKVAFYVKHIALALQQAHAHRIIHRDIKPENVLVNDCGQLVLSDFGIALIGHRTQSLSDQDIVGTSIYMAPEQAKGQARRASDQYALAVMAYEWLQGYPPFTGRTSLEIALKHMHNSPPPLQQIRSAVQPVLFKALSKNPDDRYESVAEFARHLEWVCRDEDFPINALQSSYRGHTDVIGMSGMSSYQNLMVSAGADGSVQIWNSNTHQTVMTYLGHRSEVNSVAWSPTGKWIASGGEDGQVHLWNVSTGGAEQVDHPNNGSIDGLCWSPCGTKIAWACGKTRLIHIWDVVSQEHILSYTGHYQDGADTLCLNAVAWSPSGRYIASGGEDGIVHIWGATSGVCLSRYTSSFRYPSIDSLVWFPDEDRLLYLDSECLFLCTLLPDQRERTRLEWNDVRSFALSPDGRFLAIGGKEGLISIWRWQNRRKVLTLQGHPDSVVLLHWNQSGEQIVSCGVRYIGCWDIALSDDHEKPEKNE